MLLQRARDTVEKYRMLRHGESVIAAVSGGKDSVALLDVLLRLREGYGLTLIVAHLNHNLRGRDSRRDLLFVKSLSRKHGLRFVSGTLKKGSLKAKGTSLQDEARKARYGFFKSVLKKTGADRVATAHTADDQAETVLMRLMKGAGTRGLSGIPPVRGPYIRPLIEATRPEVERHVRENGLGFVLDKTNADRKYLRNSIRLDLIPYIEKRYNPNIRETLARFALVMARDEGHLAAEAKKAFARALLERTDAVVIFDRKKLLSMDEALRSRALGMGMGSLGADTQGLYGPHYEAFHALIRGKRPNASLDFPCGVSVIREYDRVVLTLEKKPPAARAFEKKLKMSGVTGAAELSCTFKTSVLKEKPCLDGRNKQVAYLDMDSLEKPLVVRTFRPGDRIAPLGMSGTRKVKDIFIEKKIPLASRASWPMLVSGNDVLWVVGLRQSDKGKVGKDTRSFLRVECSHKGSHAF